MPTAYLKKLADEGHGSLSTLETKWDEAKAKASEEGKANNYAYVTSIFKSSLGITASIQIKAAIRLQSSSDN